MTFIPWPPFAHVLLVESSLHSVLLIWTSVALTHVLSRLDSESELCSDFLSSDLTNECLCFEVLSASLTAMKLGSCLLDNMRD